MNIGIILYSQTGHTLSVAEKLQQQLEEKGQTVIIDQVTISGEAAPDKFDFTSIPDVTPYDVVIFGAPVQGFRLCTVMEAYLQQLPSLNGKETALLVTKQLPFSWTGGTKAVSTMKKICQEKGAQVKGAEIAFWSKSKQDESVKRCVNNLSRMFS